MLLYFNRYNKYVKKRTLNINLKSNKIIRLNDKIDMINFLPLYLKMTRI